MSVPEVIGLILDIWSQIGVINIIGALIVIMAAITALSYLRR